MYEDIALRLIPPGSKPSVIQLRQGIALAINKAVMQALVNALPATIQQTQLELDQERLDLERREREFQQLADHRDREYNQTMAQREQKLKQTYEQCLAELKQRADQLAANKATFKRITLGHLELLKAVEEWLEWCCDADGDMDEHAPRREAVKIRFREYKSLLPLSKGETHVAT